MSVLIGREDRARNFRVSALIIVVGYTCFTVVGCWFLVQNGKVPNELNSETGEISTALVGRDTVTTISNSVGEFAFTCATGLGGYSQCIPDKLLPNLPRGAATVSWYEQARFPFGTSRKLVELKINGEQIISKDMTIARIEGTVNFGLWSYFWMGVFMAIIAGVLWIKSER
ncbi:hypothetical protein GIR22_21455 [Pseudomonas sp. CCM 7891]|uniref:Transmembrane protein n=1 Tax=Pseudomonas karstica TaxID=1055468 RepID=A0A7X2RXG1_9PSED|nr:hypothetical protein [Pseudomonas karstica]MTD21697.1 hypothetical protein [Pseudomonas karstica]